MVARVLKHYIILYYLIIYITLHYYGILQLALYPTWVQVESLCQRLREKHHTVMLYLEAGISGRYFALTKNGALVYVCMK